MTQFKNSIEITGTIKGSPQYDHELFGEKFYRCTVSVVRLSGVYDTLQVMIPGRLLDVLPPLAVGKNVYVRGQLRSYNKIVEGDNRNVVVLFASLITYSESAGTLNNVELRGCVAAAPIYRTTPFGREICEVLLAIGRGYGKSSYIHCVVWGRNARYASRFTPGTELELFGRLQSRDYDKVMANGEVVTRTVYEVSAQWVKDVSGECVANG